MSLYDKMYSAINNTKHYMVKHSPEILTGLGISSMIASTIFAVKATPKAILLLEDYKKTKKDNAEITPKEVIKITWKEYIIPASLCLTGVSCLISSCIIHKKRGLALATAYALSEDALLTYKNKVVETIGENKEKKIQEQINQDKINNNPPKDSQVIITSKGNTLMQDSISGRYFRSDLDTVKKIQNDLNYELTSQNYVSLNQLYSKIGLETIKNGDLLGWNVDNGLLELDFDTCLAGDEPCICINYNREPKPDYNLMC